MLTAELWGEVSKLRLGAYLQPVKGGWIMHLGNFSSRTHADAGRAVAEALAAKPKARTDGGALTLRLFNEVRVAHGLDTLTQLPKAHSIAPKPKVKKAVPLPPPPERLSSPKQKWRLF